MPLRHIFFWNENIKFLSIRGSYTLIYVGNAWISIYLQTQKPSTHIYKEKKHHNAKHKIELCFVFKAAWKAPWVGKRLRNLKTVLRMRFNDWVEKIWENNLQQFSLIARKPKWGWEWSVVLDSSSSRIFPVAVDKHPFQLSTIKMTQSFQFCFFPISMHPSSSCLRENILPQLIFLRWVLHCGSLSSIHSSWPNRLLPGRQDDMNHCPNCGMRKFSEKGS